MAKKKKVTKERESTKKNKALFLEIFKKQGCRIAVSCQKANISRLTFYTWLENDPKFKQDVNDTKEQFLDFGEGVLINLLKKEDPKIAVFFAKTKLKDRGYVERQEIEHSGSITTITDELHNAYEKSLSNRKGK